MCKLNKIRICVNNLRWAAEVHWVECWRTGREPVCGIVQTQPVLPSALLISHTALQTLELFGSHELTSWRAAVLRVRVEKACKVFRVCVNACPVDRALCTTARKSTELLFRTKNMFISFFRAIFFSSSLFYCTFCHVDSCFTIFIVRLNPWKHDHCTEITKPQRSHYGEEFLFIY